MDSKKDFYWDGELISEKCEVIADKLKKFLQSRKFSIAKTNTSITAIPKLTTGNQFKSIDSNNEFGINLSVNDQVFSILLGAYIIFKNDTVIITQNRVNDGKLILVFTIEH